MSHYARLLISDTNDSDARKQLFLEEILDEALPCIDTTIKNRFAPKGYVEEHRVDEQGSTHIFRTSLGERNGAQAGLELRILRVQYMTTGDGRKARDEREIGRGVITSEIGEDHSWISVKTSAIQQPLLEGDLVRGVYKDSFTSGLGFGKCGSILSVEGES